MAELVGFNSRIGKIGIIYKDWQDYQELARIDKDWQGLEGLTRLRRIGYIPSEKIGQNIDPLRNSFFVANYQHWTSTSALEPFLGPLDPWGALGGPWVVWGGLTTPKLPFSFEDQFKPWN